MRWNSRSVFHEIDPHELASASGRALLVERYRAVRRQVPLLYLIVLADFAGFFLTSAKVAWTDIVAMLFIVPVALIRLLHWSLTRSRPVDALTARKGLITSLIFSAGFSLLFCLWAIIVS